MLIPLVCCFLVSLQSFLADCEVGKYVTILDLPCVAVDSIASTLGATFVGMPLFVQGSEGDEVVGCLTRAGKDSVFFLLIDRNCQLVGRTNSIKDFVRVLGGSVDAQMYDSRLFLMGRSNQSYVLTRDSLEMSPNPIREEAIMEKFGDVPLAYGRGAWGDTVPSFRVQQNHLLVVSRDGVLAVYDTSGVRVYSRALPLPPGIGEFDEYVTFWKKNPLIGIYGGHLFIWDKDRIVSFDTCTALLTVTLLDSLCRREAYGEIAREAEGTASGYFIEDRGFCVFVKTERGVVGFRWRES